MIKGKTKSGFKYEIPDEAMNDMELLDILSTVSEGEIQNMAKAADKLLGEDQRRKLYDHIRTEDGRVPIDKFEAELGDIFADEKLKNSSSSSG